MSSSSGADAPADGALWWWTVSELVVVAALFLALAGDTAGATSVFPGLSPRLRAAALAFAAIELVIPLWVFFDVRRTGARAVWVHAAAMPLVNILGLAAYLVHRRRGGE